MQANQHIPIVLGAARGSEVTNSSMLRDVVENFSYFLRSNHSYATGSVRCVFMHLICYQTTAEKGLYFSLFFRNAFAYYKLLQL